MFQRQGFGAFNPFQALTGGINPFNPYAGAVNPFQQLSGGINPFNPYAGVVNPFQQLSGGINPFVAYTGGVSPFQQWTSGINPLQQQMPGQIGGFPSPLHQVGVGFNPLTAGINPFLGQAGFGVQPQLTAGINPFLGQAGFGVQPQLGAPGIGAQVPGITPGIGVSPAVAGLGLNALAAQCGYGAGGVNPYASQIGALGGFNPLLADPTAALMLAQQHSPVLQHLPIRPLVGQSPFEQFQGIGAHPILGQGIDPYTALINAQMASQLATNPLHHLIRAQMGVPYGWGAGYQSPFPQSTTPFGI